MSKPKKVLLKLFMVLLRWWFCEWENKFCNSVGMNEMGSFQEQPASSLQPPPPKGLSKAVSLGDTVLLSASFCNGFFNQLVYAIKSPRKSLCKLLQVTTKQLQDQLKWPKLSASIKFFYVRDISVLRYRRRFTLLSSLTCSTFIRLCQKLSPL